MLTDLQCRKAKAAEKDYKLSDAHGLYLFVTKTGFRSWRWKYRFAGKEKRLVLGRYPDMNLSAAREARQNAARLPKRDRKSGVWGKGVSVRVDLGGRRVIKKKKT